MSFDTRKYIKYMERAIALASRARGNTSPNPMVGAVIVNNEKIIGEGYHKKVGEPHAEIMAIEAVNNKVLLKDSTMIVSLEPCSHYGRTPPCAKRIIDEGIPKVVIGALDPSEKVGGRGVEMMKKAGLDVYTGLMEEESRELNKRFFIYHEKKRPYIILKWARSADGFIDRLRLNHEIGPNWITGLEERIMVHKWRSEEDAILVGDKTACNDDPALDVRLWGGNNPRRFILSESAELPAGLKLFRGNPATIVFSPDESKTNIKAVTIRLSSRENALEEIMSYMYQNEIQSIIIEGGYTVLSQFIDADLWDEARVFTGDVLFRKGLISPEIQGEVVCSQTFNGSVLEYLKPSVSMKKK